VTGITPIWILLKLEKMTLMIKLNNSYVPKSSLSIEIPKLLIKFSLSIFNRDKMKSPISVLWVFIIDLWDWFSQLIQEFFLETGGKKSIKMGRIHVPIINYNSSPKEERALN